MGVLESTAPIIEGASLVRIDLGAVERLAERLSDLPRTSTEWDTHHHFVGGPTETAQYLLVLDALNFCFWGEPRWRVREDDGSWVNGYWALALALKRAVLAEASILDSGSLSRISEAELGQILLPPGLSEGVAPLLSERAANLREIGRVLAESYSGQTAELIHRADRSATRLALLLAEGFSSFNDVSLWRGREARFYKRAQIFVADVSGSFGGKGLGEFTDFDRLTAFADYKVPQVLRRLGLLEYASPLAAKIRAKVEIPRDSEEELQIRAGTIWAVERLRQALRERGVERSASELDVYLWELGQTPSPNDEPYHLTRTIFY